MKNNEAYVIGLNTNTLLNIKDHMYCDRYFENWEVKVDEIVYGCLPLSAATLFQTLDEAKDILTQIIDNYKDINIRHTSLLHTMIHGNDINPQDLHIYKIGIIQEED